MPIYRLLETGAFQPEHVKAMVAAFESALVRLGLNDREDPFCDLVARKVVELGQQGEREPGRLCDATVKALTHETGVRIPAPGGALLGDGATNVAQGGPVAHDGNGPAMARPR